MSVDAVAKSGSIRKAAEILAIDSTALNRRILAIERELGFDIFERIPRGFGSPQQARFWFITFEHNLVILSV